MGCYICILIQVASSSATWNQPTQKSVFKLFEKRVPYDYHYAECNAENHGDVAAHFAVNQARTGSCYYYFRKFRKDSAITNRFYGDTPYDGRFS